MRAIIVGAGLGGLATALALQRVGITAQIYESVPELRPLGVGIMLQPDAVGVLDRLGVLAAVRPNSVPIGELAFFTRHGQKVWAEPRGTAAGHRWPQLGLHRGALQMALLRGVQAALPEPAVATGHRLVRWRQDASGVTVWLADRRTGTLLAEDRADFLVAADGIHSTVRAGLHPAEGPPLRRGAMIWRGTAETPPWLGGRTQVIIGGRQRFVAYPMRLIHGKALTNWAARLDQAVGAETAGEDWNRLGSAADILAHYAEWRFPWLDVPAVIAATEQVYAFPMLDRDPLPRWTEGRVTLLGDAAHPAYPFGSNGASQAILDAETLAESMEAAAGNVPAGLAAYEARRRPPTTALIHLGRAGGPASVIDRAEERAPDGFVDLEAVLPLAERAAIVRAYRTAAGGEGEG
jgi:2-polyprenyl-6-methoxyphenol hydroxylase-like FAD-dependent oxidoreductase